MHRDILTIFPFILSVVASFQLDRENQFFSEPHAPDQQVQLSETTLQQVQLSESTPQPQLDSEFLFGTNRSEEEHYDPRLFMTTDELIKHYKYKPETHYVTTEDGYILTVHRIAKPNSKLPPVILQHGLLVASDVWVLRGPEHDVAFQLADLGYDVWLNNARGTFYSKNHTSLSVSDDQFWKFSWHEMGKYDLPAVIDHILEKTKSSKLFYIGHSMGTTMFYVMASIRPEYNDKILVQFSLAPICFMGNMKGNQLIMPVAETADDLLEFGQFLGVREVFPRCHEVGEILYNVAKKECFPFLSSVTLLQIFGYEWKILDMEALPVFLGHFPSGTSLQTLHAYAQSVLLKDKFRQYDYGPTGNMIKYYSEDPPSYNLSAIRSPVVLFYTNNDFFSSSEDVDKLEKQLPNVIGKVLIKEKLFNHVDYMLGKNLKKLYGADIVSFMQRHLPAKPHKKS